MTAVTATRYPTAIDLAGGGTLPRIGTLVSRFLVAVLIIFGAFVAAEAAPADSVLQPPVAATTVAATTVTATTVAATEMSETGMTSHAAAARARLDSKRLLSQCLHRAHRTSADPASCLTH